MSSISAQGVVERASVELAKRINGKYKSALICALIQVDRFFASSSFLSIPIFTFATHHDGAHRRDVRPMSTGLRSKHHHGHGKTSVMERVTNALCGGSSHNSVSIGAPEKPSRVASAKQLVAGKLSSSGSNSQHGTPQSTRKLQLTAGQGPHALDSVSGGGAMGDTIIVKFRKINADVGTWTWMTKSNIHSMEQLMQDERFLNQFFQYFTPYERRTLAQVCTRWRDTLYRSPKFWSGMLPALQCRELRLMSNQDRVKLYNSLVRRGFHSVRLIGASDEDALDIVHSFPLASKHINSLSLRCASVSDRGLESLLDHLQVSGDGPSICLCTLCNAKRI